MSDRPDFTANTALNAVADTLDNLPVSINAQTLGSLAVDIAAQSAGDIDINLNTASDTVTVALGSSTTTLDTDIVAQSVGSIDTIINGQVGDVDIRFASQSGNVDINFQDQTSGVESGTEFAARQGNVFTREASATVSSGNFTNKNLFDNSTGGAVILESLTMASIDDFSENSGVRFEVSTSDPIVSDVVLVVSPATAPVQFDPGIRIESTGVIDVVLQNNATTQSQIEAFALLREL